MSPLYTGDSIFLGSSMAQAHQAFQNARKVVLKVKKPLEPLEGRSSTHKNLLATDAPLYTEPLEQSNLPALESISDRKYFEHEPGTLPDASGDAAVLEILSESPITLPEVVDYGEPSLDIPKRLIG